MKDKLVYPVMIVVGLFISLNVFIKQTRNLLQDDLGGSSELQNQEVLSESTSSNATPTSCPSQYSCPSNYTWSQSACSCVQTSESNCATPQSCPGGYSWNISYCSCRPVTPTACVSPTGGCDTGKYWDSGSCSCKSYTSGSSCQPPTTGCSTGYTWDSGSCSCKAYTPTTTYQTNSTCVTPIYGCDSNKYWNPTSCSCVSYDTQSSSTPSVTPISQPTGSSSAVYECLIQTLGKSVYDAVSSGTRPPTYEENLVYSACRGDSTPSSTAYLTSQEKISDPITNCLKSVLGESLYSQVKSGQIAPPLEYKNKIDSCFGITVRPFQGTKNYKIPDQIVACLNSEVSTTRLAEINAGSEPTSDEKKNAEGCFSKLNSTQSKFLPAPHEEIPFLNTDPEQIKLVSANQDTLKIKDKTTAGKITLSGKGPANTTIDIYIFSEPIVVSTKVDSNGDWVYELDQPLTGEKHIAYATVRTTSGKTVRSEVFNFQVQAASEDVVAALLPETQIAKPKSDYVRYVILVLGVAVVLVVAMSFMLDFKKNTEK